MLRILSVCACLAALPALAAGPFGDYDPVDFGPKGPSRYPVHGIDVARFQGEIDWRRVALSGVAFAFIKATEGGDLKDPQFDRNWTLAARHGIPRGAYHFYYFCTPPEVQARWFIQHRAAPGPGAAAGARHGMEPVLAHLHHAPVRGRGPQAGAGFPRPRRASLRPAPDHLHHAGILRPDGHRAGAGQFLAARGGETPDRVYPGQQWVFWQYTGTGLVPGVEGGVDINAFRGSNRASWRNWLRHHEK